MSIGSLPAVVASAAGTPLAQAKTEVERTNVEVGAQQRQTFNALKAESAAGIGETDGQDHEASERDADGRRLWEAPPGGKQNPAAENPEPPPPQSRDATGQSGNILDLSG
jgi:hypothetical protein